MEFTWDDQKNLTNQKKHGISFETAILVFDDPLNVSAQDREVDGERRWQTIGMVNGIHLLLVAHTLDVGLDRDDDEEVIRILIGTKGNAAGTEILCARHLEKRNRNGRATI